MVESYGKDGNIENIRQSVFALLDENPLLTAKTICARLGIPYWQYRGYVYKLKFEWKSHRQNELGSKCSNVHSWHGVCVVPAFVSREDAIAVGWKETKAKNKWLLWNDGIGRMMWFENGRVFVYVRSPANLGRVKQLISNGFFNTGLIYELRILEQVFKTFKFKGAHYVYDAGQPLPKMTIDAFQKSHGILIKTGDKSHRRAVEVISRCPDWAERNELLLGRLTELLCPESFKKEPFKKPDYVA
ncbi:MAG: hypothetical protein NWE99_03725 [Candidatus Bathyarchaeota archaeon]|nr:hypothetical protein [Candidatus Bathyarchaeota archaeon]